MKPIPQTKLRGKKAIIFDMDGTLVDDLIAAMNRTIAQMIKNFTGSQITADTVQKQREKFVKDNRGCPNIYKAYNAFMVKHYKFKQTADESWEMFKKSLPDMINKLEFRPHAAEFLVRLKNKNFKLALATNNVGFVFEAMQKNKNLFINNAPFDKIFDLVVSSEDVTNVKPAPDIYLKVLEKLNISHEKCLVFEDTSDGIRAAKSAGIDVINVCDFNADYKHLFPVLDLV